MTAPQATRFDWSPEASSALLDYAKAYPFFTAEDAWSHIEKFIGPPPVPNLKGALFRITLIQPGHVLRYSTAAAQNKSAKGRLLVVWKSTLCHSSEELVSVATQLSLIRADINTHKITLMQGLEKAYVVGTGGFTS